MSPLPTARHPRSLTTLAILLLATLAFACGDGVPAEPDQTYELRGQVQQLPEGRRHEIFIHHEAVPEFVSSEGEVVGMESMTMPFQPAEPDLVKELEVGDKIAFDLEVRWEGPQPLIIRRLRKLPAETILDFENARRENHADPP